jgi:hypothetical protein
MFKVFVNKLYARQARPLGDIEYRGVMAWRGIHPEYR